MSKELSSISSNKEKIIIISLILLIIIWGIAVAVFYHSNHYGDVHSVNVTQVQSQIHSQKEIDSAIKSTMFFFNWVFDDCVLTEISYAGDKETLLEAEWYKTSPDNIIILTSNYYIKENESIDSQADDNQRPGWGWHLKKIAGFWIVINNGYA